MSKLSPKVDWKKPFTKKDQSRLRRVCDVVRETLIGPIPTEYIIAGKNKTSLAASFIPSAGWRVQIYFYDLFFDQPLESQIATIVHEHVHVMNQPVDQILQRCDHLIPKRNQSEFWTQIHVAREIVVERASGVLAKLLMPQIAQVL